MTPFSVDIKNLGSKLLIGFVMYLCSIGVSAQPTTSHYQVKAVFLYNFIHFVEWPPTSFADSNAPFIIGILGENVLGVYLEDLVRNENIDSHPLVIEYYSNVAEIKNCHILFINSKEVSNEALSLQSLAGRGILTVSDADAFVQKGGIIGFFNEKKRIRFNINLEAAKDANLKFSSKLLRLAQTLKVKNP